MALLALAGFALGLATTAAFFTLWRRPPASRPDGPAPAGPLTVIDTLFESTPNGIGVWDRELRFRRVNPALAAINGVPAEAHLGRRLREVVPGLADALEPVFREVLKTGEAVVNQELLGESPARPGEQRFWRASYYPVRGGNGGIDGVSAVVVDMTESRNTEQALRKSEERYRAFIEQTAEAVWRIEMEEPVPVSLPVEEQLSRFIATGYLAECNDAMARMYGFGSAGEILGARLSDLLDMSDPKNMDYLTAFVRSGYRLIEAESHERAKDGSDRYFLNNLIGIVEHGAVSRGWGTQRDITQRKWADQALRESREQLRVALKAAQMATWRWDLKTDVRAWDGEIPGLFRDAENPTHGQGRAFLDQVHPDDRARLTEAVSAAVDGAGQFREEYRILSSNGSIHWLTDQGQVFRDAGGQRVYLAGTCVDVTHRRQVEEQLRQVQRMEAVGRLAGGMAHETNNQMAVVLGFADFVLGRRDLAERVREDVEQIRKAAERTAGITSQLLAFSRRQLARPRVLDLNETVSAFEPVLRRAMSDGCELVFRLAPDLGPVKADPGQVEQILLNLALNACDAMPQGGTLTVETAVVSLSQEYVRLKTGVRVQPGQYVRLAMSDTGHGMSRETLSRVFEPFFTTKAVGQGTGLGLSTVYGLVKQADGNIWVYSEPGIGTTFKVYLPVIAAEQPLVPQPEPAQSGSGEMVLVVEDEPDVRRMTVRSLSEAGYTVLEASGGEEALQIILEAGDRLRVVVTDVAMAEMNGRELGDRITALHPRLPVIFMSGYTDEDVIKRGLMERGRRFIQKPFSPDTLARQVHDALTSHRSSPP